MTVGGKSSDRPSPTVIVDVGREPSALHLRRMPTALKLTPHDERRVAVVAGCDPRTVRAFLEGRPQRSTIASRVAEALRVLDLAHVAPQARPEDGGGGESASLPPGGES